MKTTLTILTAGLLAVAAPAMADSNKDAAQNMAAALKGGGGGNNSPIKEALGLEGNGGVASYVSGGGTGGWGNVGSGLVGDQVSKRNK
ncbi:hypothetical protein OEW28_06095 [Defluviimonas sp. WL0002]|uniref:Uncharacterized protein n=1 Tax=Albidovulum marisflavi TaxID=2984159 RepID=A0ABT2ZAR1_9RHOB|nr:hypothetical protein [Defluviimonas sp. WL0002]MCV2868196.1 hypothetical protein [Defluviimonas sp. WL0002]